MPKKRNPKRDLAFELWLKSHKQRALNDIAKELKVSASTVRKWKCQDDWEGSAQNPKGAQYGNTNAKGGNQSAPKKNQNARTHGFYSKWLPAETLEIINQMPTDPLDILWDNIQISYAAIIRAQNLMYVKSQEDVTVAVTSESETGTIYDVQQAWDKQANFMQAQARAQQQLQSLIDKYTKLLDQRGESATEEQRLRIEKIRCDISKVKAETEKLKGGDNMTTEDKVAKLFDAIGGELNGPN